MQGTVWTGPDESVLHVVLHVVGQCWYIGGVGGSIRRTDWGKPKTVEPQCHLQTERTGSVMRDGIRGQESQQRKGGLRVEREPTRAGKLLCGKGSSPRFKET